MKVKEQTYNGEFSGYLVNGTTFFPKENCELIKKWIAEGNTPEPEFTEEEIEAKRIQTIKSKAGELINSKYPDYKQLNIIRTGGANLTEMTDYIDGIRTISNEAESNGTKVEDIIWQ